MYQKITGVKGLISTFNAVAFALPNQTPPTLKKGLEYSNDKLKFKLNGDLRNWTLENQLTYRCCSAFLAGYSVTLDPKTQNIDKHELGINWEPAQGAQIGLKSLGEGLKFSKFVLLFHHAASASKVVGTEFSLDWVS